MNRICIAPEFERYWLSEYNKLARELGYVGPNVYRGSLMRNEYIKKKMEALALHNFYKNMRKDFPWDDDYEVFLAARRFLTKARPRVPGIY